MSKSQERTKYMEQCQNRVQDLIQNQKLQIRYVRRTRMNHTDNFVPASKEHVAVIRKFLNIVGPNLNANRALAGINMLLPEGEKFAIGNEPEAESSRLTYHRIRRQWISKHSGIKGVVVSFVMDGIQRIGWSMCDPKDKFNRYYGICKAVDHSVPLETMRQMVGPTQSWITNQQTASPPDTVVSEIETMISFIDQKANGQSVENTNPTASN